MKVSLGGLLMFFKTPWRIIKEPWENVKNAWKKQGEVYSKRNVLIWWIIGLTFATLFFKGYGHLRAFYSTSCEIYIRCNHHWVFTLCDILGVLSSLFLMCALFWGIYRLNKLLQNNFVRAIVFVILFMVGVVVYSFASLEDRTFVVNNALATFFPSRGDYDVTKVASRVAPFYNLYHLYVYWYFILLALSFFGKRLINVFTTWWEFERQDDKERYVFWGYSKQAVWLAKDLTEKRGALCMILLSAKTDEETLKDQINELDENHVYWRVVDVDIDFAPPKRTFEEILNHVLISFDQHRNIELAKYLMETFKMINEANADVKSEKGGCKFYVEIGDGELCNVFTEWADDVNKKKRHEICLINENALVAQDFTLTHPMLCCPGITVNDNATVTGEFHVLLLGFGWLGREILKNMVCDAQFVGTQFHVDIVDQDANTYERFQRQCTEAVTQYDLRFHNVNVSSARFHDWMTGKPRMWMDEHHRRPLEGYNRIVVCLGNDELNAETDYFLRVLAKERTPKGKLEEGTLFTYIKNRYSPVYKNDGEGKAGLFHYFGKGSDIYTEKRFMQDTVENAARRMNYFWFRKDGDCAGIDEAWKTRSMFDRLSSKASAMGMYNILRLVAMAMLHERIERISKKLKMNDSEKASYCVKMLRMYDSFSGADDRQAKGFSNRDTAYKYYRRLDLKLKVLAETEHLRWNAFHFMRGIHTWDLKNPGLEILKEKKANQIKDHNCHGYLVPFDELTRVDAQIATVKYPDCHCHQKPDPVVYEMRGAQKNDVDFIINIPAIFGKSESLSENMMILKTIIGLYQGLDGESDNTKGSSKRLFADNLDKDDVRREYLDSLFDAIYGLGKKVTMGSELSGLRKGTKQTESTAQKIDFLKNEIEILVSFGARIKRAMNGKTCEEWFINGHEEDYLDRLKIEFIEKQVKLILISTLSEAFEYDYENAKGKKKKATHYRDVIMNVVHVNYDRKYKDAIGAYDKVRADLLEKVKVEKIAIDLSKDDYDMEFVEDLIKDAGCKDKPYAPILDSIKLKELVENACAEMRKRLVSVL